MKEQREAKQEFSAKQNLVVLDGMGKTSRSAVSHHYGCSRCFIAPSALVRISFWAHGITKEEIAANEKGAMRTDRRGKGQQYETPWIQTGVRLLSPVLYALWNLTWDC